MTDRFGSPRIGIAVGTLMQDVFNDFTPTRPEALTKVARLEGALGQLGTVVSAGLVEDEAQAAAARSLLLAADVDLVVYSALSYVKSAVPLRLLMRLPVPVLIWNTQQCAAAPANAGFDTMWIESGMAGLPGTTHALMRAGVSFTIVTSELTAADGLAPLRPIVAAAQAAAVLRRARIAAVGHVYEGMTDFMVDHAALHTQVGPLTVPVDAFRITQALATIGDDAAAALTAADRVRYGSVDVAEDAFRASARLALAMEKVFCQEEEAQAVAILDQTWLAEPRIGIVATYGYIHLNRNGVPCVCEVDVPTAVAQLVLEQLAGPSLLGEFYDMDFDRDAIVLCHDSNGNPLLAAAADAVQLRAAPMYVGVNGPGVTCEFACPPGPVTLLALTNLGNSWRFVVAEGVAIESPPRPMGAPFMLFRHPRLGLADLCNSWCRSGATHHLGVAYGSAAAAVQALGNILGLETLVL